MALAMLAAAAGCERRVVSAKGIGSERYIVEPDPEPETSRSRGKTFAPPRTHNPTSATQRTAPR